MSIIGNEILAGAAGQGGYFLDNSLRFRSSASAYLSRTPASSSNRKTWTWSAWVKRGKIGSGAYALFGAGNSNTNFGGIYFNYSSTTDDIEVLDYPGASSTWLTTNALYRDVSAWYHVVVAYDTTQATSSNRVKLYVNGEQVTSFASAAYPTQNSDSRFNSTLLHTVGAQSAAAVGAYFDGYLTEINFIDGQALTADDFGETDATTGVWKPKEYQGTYGTNGFYLPTTATTQAEGFNTVLWSGDGGTSQISNVGFNPDFVWIKARNSAQPNVLYDTVRGAGGSSELVSNSTAAEGSTSGGFYGHVSSFDTNGFTVASGSSNAAYTNYSGFNYVAWCWDAGSGSPASNTDGDIPSTVKANDATGFSIVSYTGTGTAGDTVGHGLTSAPEMVIVKRRDSTGDWLVWNETIASSNSSNVLFLNDTAGATANSSNFNSTAPTSSVFTVGSNAATNSSGGTHIAYCFHSVAGYSDFDTYTGTGSSGNTVTTGFRPAFLMIKATDASATGWIMVDNTRDPDNLASEYIYADSSAAEATYTNILEFTDTGFELIIGAGSAVNSSGVNYIYMAFADTRDSQFNFDASGNKNNWTPNNINSNASSESSYDIMTDVPTLTDTNTANYCTWNPLALGTNFTTANGNLDASCSTSSNTMLKSTFGLSSGKWYWESTLSSGTSSWSGSILKDNAGLSYSVLSSGDAYSYSNNGNKYNGQTASSYGDTYTTGDLVGVALDMDNGKIWFAKNGVWQASGDPEAGTNEAFSGISGTYLPAALLNTSTGIANFGQRPFAYTPPTGFLPLNTYNLPDSTIVDGLDHFEATTYSGTSARRDVSLQKFNPSFIWTKARNTAYNHFLYNEVVGTSTHLSSNLTSASQGNNGLVAFSPQTADFGYDLTSGQINETGKTYVSWNWKANGSGVSNSEGDITVTVSADTTSGFSIVKGTYTGVASSQTFGHGLGATPAMIITKDISGASNFGIWHETYGATSGNTQIMIFNTNATLSAGNYMGTVSSTLSSVSSGLIVNGNDFVQWIWTEVEGFSAFGSYTGNGSADGPFIYTGFRPAWIMVKRTDSADNWWMQDNARDPYNVAKHYLSANTNNAEFSNLDVYDYTANGFKIRTTTTAVNASGSTYIYAAFAENPFKNSLAR